MGWMGPVVEDQEHQGRVVPPFETARKASAPPAPAASRRRQRTRAAPESPALVPASPCVWLCQMRHHSAARSPSIGMCTCLVKRKSVRITSSVN